MVYIYILYYHHYYHYYCHYHYIVSIIITITVNNVGTTRDLARPANLKMVIEIVDVPIKNGHFP